MAISIGGAGATGGAPAGTATTFRFNSADNDGLTLSDSDRSAVAAVAGGVRGVASYSSGKLYFEYLIAVLGDNDANMFGVANASAVLATNSSVDRAVATPTAVAFQYNALVGAGLGATAAANANIIAALNRTFCVAYDANIGSLWFGLNGLFFGSPANGTGAQITGLTIGGPYFPYIRLGNAGTSMKLTIPLLTAYAAPAGFSVA